MKKLKGPAGSWARWNSPSVSVRVKSGLPARRTSAAGTPRAEVASDTLPVRMAEPWVAAWAAPPLATAARTRPALKPAREATFRYPLRRGAGAGAGGGGSGILLFHIIDVKRHCPSLWRRAPTHLPVSASAVIPAGAAGPGTSANSYAPRATPTGPLAI